jgi:galactose mutarotase-like enzyme
MELEQTKIDGLTGLVLEDDLYQILILPDVGAKMASLVNKTTSREFLWRNPDRPYRRPDYAGLYEEYDISGFDECFPNIGAGVHPVYPWQGVPLPDHGELWTIPWDWEFSGGGLHLWVYGVRCPYRFDKWVSRKGEALLLEYRVTNLAPYPFPCLWSAHPLFAVSPGSRILLPEGVRVRTDWSKENRLGPICTEHPWPMTTDTAGQRVDLSFVTSGQLGFADKLYSTRLTEGWCALHDPATGDFVSFAFSTDEVPYVGVWINQGGWPLVGGKCFNVALEPCTGYPDRLDIAVLRNEFQSVPPRGTLEWSLRLSAGQADDVVAAARQMTQA